MRILSLLVCLSIIFGCKQKIQETTVDSMLESTVNKEETNTYKIAFGSCSEEDKPQPLLEVAVGLSPDLFIYLGDNIYGDTYSMDTLKMKYDELAHKKEFKSLRASTKILSVWDDHDFGWNDAGRHYPHKVESKNIFMDFWGVPTDSDRRKHEGIYGVEHINANGMDIQIIMLDTRTFRDDLVKYNGENSKYKNDYQPNMVADSTFLGKEQWDWLDKVLQQKADVRIVASSNQFSHEYNGWESWTNVPHEQQKFIDLIAKNKSNGIIFLSGDVHWGEISRKKTENTYPLYDVTSSGITEVWPNFEENKNRVGKIITQNNIGLLGITKNGNDIDISMSLYDATSKPVVFHQIKKSEISF